MKKDSELRRQLDEARAECRALHMQLADLIRERDALLAETVRLRAAFEEAAIEKSRMALTVLDGLASDAELAERKERRRRASQKTGTKKNPALEFAHDWVLRKVRAGECDEPNPTKLLVALIDDAKAAGHEDVNQSLKWLNARIRDGRAEVAAERQYAEDEKERRRLEEQGAEREQRLASIDASWVPATSNEPDD